MKSIKYVFCDALVSFASYVRRKVGLLTVTETLAQENFDASRVWTSAYYSRLGWLFDLEPRLNQISAPLIVSREGMEHRYYVIREPSNRFHFQIAAHTSRLYPPKPGDSGSQRPVVEEPASLVFSCHPNGSVVVIVYPHKSEWMTFGRDDHYVIGHYSCTNALAGSYGNALIQQHIKVFLKLANLSLSASIPTKASAKFLAKLEMKANHYSRIYGSKTEQRRAIADSELALGAGLAAGLIASTLFPMVQSIGKEAADRAKSIAMQCKASDSQVTQLCLNDDSYEFHRLIASIFSTDKLVVAAALIVIWVIAIMWRRLKA